MVNEAVTAPSPESENHPPRRRRWLRRILMTSLILLIVLLGVGIFLPQLISTPPGRGLLTTVINRSIPGTVQIDSLQLNWFNPQRIEGLTLHDPEGHLVLELESAETAAGIWNLIFDSVYEIGETRLARPAILLRIDEQGVTSLENALGLQRDPRDDQPTEQIYLPIIGAIHIEEGQLRWNGPDGIGASIDQLNLVINKPGLDEPLDLELTAQARRSNPNQSADDADTSTGLLDISTRVQGFDQNGRLEARSLDEVKLTSFHVKATRFPMEAIDQLLASLRPDLSGAIIAWGDEAAVTASGFGSLDHGEMSLSVQASRVNLTANTKIKSGLMSGSAIGQVTLSPEALEPWLRQIPAEQRPVLSDAVEVDIQLSRGQFPMGWLLKPDRTFRAGEVAIVLNGQISDGSLSNIPEVGREAWRDVSFAIDAPNAGEAINLKITGKSTREAGETLVDVDLSAKGLLKDGPRPDVDLENLALTGRAVLSNLPLSWLDRLTGDRYELVNRLGEQMDLTLVGTQEPDTDRRTITLSIVSPKLTGDRIRLQLTREQITLEEVATLKYELDAASANRLLAAPLRRGEAENESPGLFKDFTFTSPLTADLILGSFNLDLPGEGESYSPSRIAISADLALGKFSAVGLPRLKDAQLQGATIKLRGPSLAQLDVEASALIRFSDEQIAAALGETASLHATTSGSLADDFKSANLAWTASLDLASRNALANLTGTLTPTALTINPRSTISVRLTPAMLRALDVDLPEKYAITRMTQAGVTVESFTLPIGADGAGPSFVLTAELTPGGDDLLTAALGAETSRMQFTLAPHQRGEAMPLILAIRDGQIETTLNARLDDTGMLKLREATPFRMTITPEFLTRMGWLKADGPTLARPTELSADLKTLDYPVTDYNISRVRLVAEGVLSELALTGDDRLNRAVLRQNQIALAVNEQQNRLRFTLNGMSHFQNETGTETLQTGRVTAFADLKGWLGEQDVDLMSARGQVNLAADSVPTSLVEALTGQAGKLQPYLGKDVKADLTIHRPDTPAAGDAAAMGEAKITLSSAQARLKADLVLREQADGLRISLRENGEAAELRFTPPSGQVLFARKPPRVEARPDDADGSLSGFMRLIRTTPGSPRPAAPAADPGSVIVERSGTVRLQVDHLDYFHAHHRPEGSRLFDPSKARLGLTLHVDGLALRDTQTQEVTTIENLKGPISTAWDASRDAGPESLQRGVSVDLSGRIRTVAAPAPQARDQAANAAPAPVEATFTLVEEPAALRSDELKIQGLVRDLFTDEGEFNRLSSLTATLDVVLPRIPGPWVDDLSNAQGNVLMMFGNSLGLTAGTNLNTGTGRANVLLIGRGTRVQIPGQIRDGVFTLTEPLRVEALVTPEVSQNYLGTFSLFAATADSGLRPMQIVVDPKDFSIPVENFSLDKINVGNIRVDLGRVELLNDGPLMASAVRLLNLSDEKNKIDAWFAPFDVTIRNGVLNYKSRVDLRLGKYHISQWGTADLVNKQFNMTLGIPGTTLKRIKGLKRINDQAMLRVSIRQTPQGFSFDWQSAASDIARLAVQDQLAGKNPLAAALADAAIRGILDKGGQVPAQSMDKLPWADLPEESDEEPDPEAGPPAEGDDQAAESAESDQPAADEPANKPERPEDVLLRMALEALLRKR